MVLFRVIDDYDVTDFTRERSSLNSYNHLLSTRSGIRTLLESHLSSSTCTGWCTSSVAIFAFCNRPLCLILDTCPVLIEAKPIRSFSLYNCVSSSGQVYVYSCSTAAPVKEIEYLNT